MKRLLILLLLPLLLFTGRAQVGATVSAAPVDPRVMFVENTGQFDDRVRFSVRLGQEMLWLTDDGLWLTIMNLSPADNSEGPAGLHLQLDFPGRNRQARLVPFAPLDTVVSYPGHYDVPVWGGVRYVELFPGLDLVLGGEGGRWTWRLVSNDGRPGRKVPLRVEGAEILAVDSQGLQLAGLAGNYRLVLPGEATLVDANVMLTAGPAMPISPSIPAVGEANMAGLGYSTFVGGAASDEGTSVAVDAAGRAYVTGKTSSTPFPARPGPFEPLHNVDVFILRLDAVGSAMDYLLWFDSVGSAAIEEHAWSLAVDSTGRAYVAGDIYASDFCAAFGPVPGYDTTYNGNGDGFVLRVNASGTGLEYCTYLGGGESDDIDLAYALAVDGSGGAYVTGSTWSADFPTTAGAYDSGHNGQEDVFIIGLNPAGTVVTLGTFVGGGSREAGRGIALDTAGNIYVTGWTTSTDFPTTPGAFDRSHNGGLIDAFALKLNAGGGSLGYSTFLGGGDEERALAVAVNGSAAFVTGSTKSNGFPTTPGAYDRTFGGGVCDTLPCLDTFVAKLNSLGSALSYSTFLGGNSADQGNGIAVDGTGRAYVIGQTESAAAFPTTPFAFDRLPNGDVDAFLTVISSGGSGLDYSTFLGGAFSDIGTGVAIDNQDRVYMMGQTQSANFPVTAGVYDPTHNGDNDVFVTRLTLPELWHVFVPASLGSAAD